MKNKKDKPKLPKTFKTKFLKALRSGNYEQGSGFLKIKNDKTDKFEYCCLGVACHIAGVTGLNKKCIIKNGTYGDVLGNGIVIIDGTQNLKHILKSIGKVPEILRGNPTENNIVNKLVSMNDNGKSFKVIANWIEKHL